MKLKTKFLCLIAVLLAVSLGANLVWTSANKHSQMENELREQARALAQQMDAVWEFMVANQDRLAQVAFTEDGVYQGLHCAIAGLIIGQSFTMHSDYTTRFVNFNPRNKAGEPTTTRRPRSPRSTTMQVVPTTMALPTMRAARSFAMWLP